MERFFMMLNICPLPLATLPRAKCEMSVLANRFFHNIFPSPTQHGLLFQTNLKAESQQAGTGTRHFQYEPPRSTIAT